MRALRIAILTHSTNPRGGVAHCLSLAEALCTMGHEAVVHAPDPDGRGFFRAAACPMRVVAATPVQDGTVALVGQRIEDYLRHFASPAARDFDVFHAHDGVGGNALATLRRRRLIRGFVRTVHHIDAFANQQLANWQERAITAASQVLCVSRTWQAMLARDYGIAAGLVGNGVDRDVYTDAEDTGDAGVAAEFGLGVGPVFLSVGGFEARKNARRLVEAFARVRETLPEAQLLVVGGASLFDHAAYQAEVRACLDRLGLPLGRGKAVIETGPVPHVMMPALYRLASALVFPSLKEGFGLAVLEAMASGTPTIVSQIAPFTEYLHDGDTLFVDPTRADDIAAAMAAVLVPETRDRLRLAGRRIAGSHSWAACAKRHLRVYEACRRETEDRLHA